MLKIRFDANFNHIGIAGEQERIVNDVLISRQIPPDEADALIVYWEPTPLLAAFDKPKIFYCCEPSYYFQGFRKHGLRKILSHLNSDEFAYHNHPNPLLRVPHQTHETQEYIANYNDNRKSQAVAVVSNIRNPLLRHADMRYRIRFITHQLVDLYGQKKTWLNFRNTIFSSKAPPPNYQGELKSRFAGKIELISTYKVSLCLENSYEENYFTEKFVDAVRAGCIPIYRAHPSVKEGILNGAFWVDPADFGDDPEATIKYALSLDGKEIYHNNIEWFNSEEVQRTYLFSVYERMSEILLKKIEGVIKDGRKIYRV
jgi:hypothetical protein